MRSISDVTSLFTPELCVAAVAEGRRAVFIDDGGAGNHTLPPEVLVQDFELFVAVVIDSEGCTKLDAAHDEWLREARLDAPGVNELHATELANPKKGKSPWYGVSEERRTYHLRRAYETFPDTIEEIHYGYIGGEQYKALIERARELHPGEELHAHYRTQKRGLARNFYKVLGERFAQTEHEFVVFHDAGFYQGWVREEIFLKSVPVWEQSIIHAPSHSLAGLQVADLVAWTINRQPIALARSQPRGFDVLALAASSSWAPKLRNAW